MIKLFKDFKNSIKSSKKNTFDNLDNLNFWKKEIKNKRIKTYSV
jgi:hypothetical protein